MSTTPDIERMKKLLGLTASPAVVPVSEVFKLGDPTLADITEGPHNPICTCGEDEAGYGVPDPNCPFHTNPIDIAQEGVEPQKVIVVRDTALDLDMWDVQRGQACLAESPALQKAFPKVDMKILNDARKDAENAVADMHAVAYLMDPRPVDHCTDPRRLEYVKTLLESAECQALRQSTVMNELASEMAATQFGQEWAKLVQADAEQAKKDAGRKGGPPSPEKQAMKAEMGLRKAVASAIDKAKTEVESMDDVARGLGGDGSLGNNPQDAKKIAEAYKRVRGNQTLKEIFNRAGKFRRFMQSMQRRKTVHGTDDVVGVENAGDVGRLLPVELAKIADDDFELDTLRRLVEGQTMCRLYQGVEKVAKGPVVVCVDESGSMSGNPIWNAKAFALAMAVMAKQQGRWCTLVGYSGGTEGTWVTLPPGKWDQAALLEWLGHFFGGGTDLDIPLEKVPSMWKEWEKSGLKKGKTDLILITDAVVDVGDAMASTFNAWKAENKCKTVSLVIGHDAGSLKKVSDEVHLVSGIDTNQEGVAKCLAL